MKGFWSKIFAWEAISILNFTRKKHNFFAPSHKYPDPWISLCCHHNWILIVRSEISNIPSKNTYMSIFAIILQVTVILSTWWCVVQTIPRQTPPKIFQILRVLQRKLRNPPQKKFFLRNLKNARNRSKKFFLNI